VNVVVIEERRLTQSVRSVKSPRSPAEVLFSRRVSSSVIERKSVDEFQYSHVSEQPPAPRVGCSGIEFSSVAFPLRSVASVLRQVASAYGPDSDPRKSPRNVLVGAFQQLRRTARSSVHASLAKRFAISSKRSVMRAWPASGEFVAGRHVRH
jgi:hypothetical protein